MNDRRDRMKIIQALAFAKTEVELFLDTHPTNTAALAAFMRYRDELNTAVADYEKRYGALTTDAVKGQRWTWAEGAWPWEQEDKANVDL